MALKKHHRCLDKLVIALSALAEGDTDTAEEFLADVVEDEDELRDALEDISDSQEETLGDKETSGEDCDEDESEDEEELSKAKASRKPGKTDKEFYIGKDEDSGEFTVRGLTTDKVYFSGTAAEAKTALKRVEAGETPVAISSEEEEFDAEFEEELSKLRRRAKARAKALATEVEDESKSEDEEETESEEEVASSAKSKKRPAAKSKAVASARDRLTRVRGNLSTL